LFLLDSGLAEIIRNTEPDVVAFQTGVPKQNRIRQSALAKQMQLVFARSEINRRQVFCGHFAIGSHGKSGDDKWAFAASPHREENAEPAFATLRRGRRSTPIDREQASNVQCLTF
jgi:hypothetical protein